jgi:hypothetical protein
MPGTWKAFQRQGMPLKEKVEQQLGQQIHPHVLFPSMVLSES